MSLSNLDINVGAPSQHSENIPFHGSSAMPKLYTPKMFDPELMHLYPSPSYDPYYYYEEECYSPVGAPSPDRSDEYKAKFTPQFCNKCDTVHNPFGLCHNQACGICYSKCHLDLYCPCFCDIQQGVKFDSNKYELICHCGFPFFDPEKWACTLKHCNSTEARLRLKECEICEENNQDHHTTFDCPVDKARAAALKAELWDMANSLTLVSIAPIGSFVNYDS